MSRSKAAVDLLSSRETAFVANFKGDSAEAARLIGCKNPASDAHKIMTRPRVQKALKQKQDAVLARMARDHSKEAVIQVAILDERLMDAINICALTAPDKLSPLLRLGYERAGVLGKTSEQEDRVGALKRADGSIEVYRSKWLKASSGESDNQSTGSDPVVPED